MWSSFSSFVGFEFLNLKVRDYKYDCRNEDEISALTLQTMNSRVF